MGRPGSALDNAAIESFYSTLEFELRKLEHSTTKAEARRRVSEWIDEYNRDPRRSTGTPRWACAARSTTNWPSTPTEPRLRAAATRDHGNEPEEQSHHHDPLRRSLYGCRGLPQSRRLPGDRKPDPRR